MKKIKLWIKAFRVPSQLFILLPLLLGASLFSAQGGRISLSFLILSLLFSVAIQLFIVFANDFADIQLDAINTTYTPFSGGSRVLVESTISREALGKAALGACVCSIVLGIIMHSVARPLSLFFILISIFLLWAYSYKPFRISYRGGGELLQMTGMGVVLPLFGYYLQSGSLHSFPWPYFSVLLPLNLTSALSTALPDEPSDRVGGKKTLAVFFGVRRVKYAVIVLHLFAILMFIRVLGDEFSLFSKLIALALPVLSLCAMVSFQKKATPGSKEMTLFVFFSILASIGFFVALIVNGFVC